jgi:hypothetical protein
MTASGTPCFASSTSASLEVSTRTSLVWIFA